MATVTAVDDPILQTLEVDGIRDFPADLGAFSLESLSVRYSFTRDDYHAALGSLPGADELPDHLKTVIHETTHLLHTTTTPFGLLMHRLRWLQAHLVIDTIQTIRGRGHGVRFPLAGMVRTLPGPVRVEAEQRLRAWYGIELLVLIMLGETDLWEKHLLRNPYLRGASLAGLFAHVQHLVARHSALERKLLADDAPAAPPARPGGPAGGSPALEPVEVAEQASDEVQLLTFDLLSGGANTLAIIESAGTAAEFWGSRRFTLDQFRAAVTGAPWTSTTAPRSWLLEGLHRLRATSLPGFIVSYLAVCEVALSGPVLPHHRSLRKGRIDLRELVPFLRWINLLMAASEIPPMSSLHDYERYTTALCEALGWAPPRAVVEASVAASPDMPDDRVERIYWKAQRVRRQAPGAFLDYPFLLGRLPMDFDFPVIAYRDRTLFLKDKIALGSFVIGYLTRAIARRMLLHADVRVALPYDATGPEKAFYTAQLGAVLEGALGTRVPGVSVV
jgi:hypothetical protein